MLDIKSIVSDFVSKYFNRTTSLKSKLITKENNLYKFNPDVFIKIPEVSKAIALLLTNTDTMSEWLKQGRLDRIVIFSNEDLIAHSTYFKANDIDPGLPDDPAWLWEKEVISISSAYYGIPVPLEYTPLSVDLTRDLIYTETCMYEITDVKKMLIDNTIPICEPSAKCVFADLFVCKDNIKSIAMRKHNGRRLLPHNLLTAIRKEIPMAYTIIGEDLIQLKRLLTIIHYEEKIPIPIIYLYKDRNILDYIDDQNIVSELPTADFWRRSKAKA